MNAQQRVFVLEYLKDLNATQAAIRAGYSKKTAASIGSENLKKPEIMAAVQSAMQKRADRTEVTIDWVVKRLAQIAGADMSHVADWNESGVTFKDSSSLSEDAKASILAVEETTNEHGGSLKIKQHDKLKALELLGRHLGMFNDKLQLTRGDASNPAIDVESEVLHGLLESPRERDT